MFKPQIIYLITTVFLFLFALSNQKICAQIPNQPVTFQSPNASTLGLFGNVPVSYFTGLPQISVPMYAFQENGIAVPIGLSYHASGFRPDMHPGWTGLNWSLSSLFSITRTVNDYPDDHNKVGILPTQEVLNDSAGFFWHKIFLDTPVWNQTSYMHFLISNRVDAGDLEPDEFSFNYPGGSGKFYFDTKGKCEVKCDKPVTITFDNTFLSVPFSPPLLGQSYQSVYGNTKSFSGFTLTDEQGFKYIYGKDTSAIEYSIDFFFQYRYEWIAQAWHLTKIISPEGQEVVFKYQRDNPINQMNISIYCNLEMKASTSGGGFLSVGCSFGSDADKALPYKGKLISPSYLTSINGSNTIIRFSRSNSTELAYPRTAYGPYLQKFNEANNPTNDNLPFLPFVDPTPYSDTTAATLSLLKFKKLDSIIVEGASGIALRKFFLGYNNVVTERLMLRSVTEIGANNEFAPPYQFFYDSSIALPPYLANKNDHWGFYNNVAASLNLPADFATYNAKREPDSTYARMATLNKIIYPTGGVTEFVYEPHIYSKRLYEQRTLGVDPSYSTNTLTGGLRIKKIISYDQTTPTIKQTKEYSYDVGGVSTGVLGGRIKYDFDDYRIPSFNDPSVTYSRHVFSSSSLLPGDIGAQGSHIGYSLVTEKNSDNSYTKYYYSNFDNNNIDDLPDALLHISRTPYEPCSYRDADRGNLLVEENYSSANVLLKKKEIFYTALNKSTEWARAFKAEYISVCGGGTGAEDGTAYKLYTYSYLPVQEKITEYDETGSNPLVTNKYFSYNTNRLLSKDSTWDSRGQNVQTYYRYPFDVLNYTLSGSIPNTKPMGYMVQNNIIGNPVEIISTKKIFGSEVVTSSTMTEFKNYSTFVKPYKRYVYNSPTSTVLKSAYTNCLVSGGGSETLSKDSRLEQRELFNGYDTHGNITDYAKDQDVNVAYEWDYKLNYPTVKIINATSAVTKQFFYQGFENDINSGVKPFAGKNCYAGDYTVPYIGLGGNYSIDYRYLDAGTWKYKKAAYTIGMTLSDGTAIDEVRIYKSDAQIATYTYDLINGMTSQSDANGKTEKYVYDGLGRLIVVKDDQENILKRICYTYYGQTQNCAIDTSALWQFTGDKRCKPCAFNPAYSTLTGQRLKVNSNPNSATYNDTMWVDSGIDSSCLMSIPTGWVQTATALTCQKNGTNNNTGYTIREDIDTAKCSYTYNLTRLVVHNYNTSMCPINSTNIRMTSPYTLSGGYITFTGTAGTFTFNFPNSSTSSYLLGTIPGDVYNVTIYSGGSSYTFTANGNYAFYGSSNTISGLMVGGTNWTLGAN